MNQANWTAIFIFVAVIAFIVVIAALRDGVKKWRTAATLAAAREELLGTAVALAVLASCLGLFGFFNLRSSRASDAKRAYATADWTVQTYLKHDRPDFVDPGLGQEARRNLLRNWGRAA